MNNLFVGFAKKVELPERNFLYIHDEVPDIPRARFFDPVRDCFNPLHRIDHKGAQQLADILYTISPEGQSTLTVRRGRAALKPLLKNSSRLDKLKTGSATEQAGTQEALELVSDILFSPMVKHSLCGSRNTFLFDRMCRHDAACRHCKSIILARVNRAELGDLDALIIGLFLIQQYKGQVVIPDFGFYGRDHHINLIHQKRLIAGVNYLDELKPRAPLLRHAILSIEEKHANGALYEDAETLAKHAHLRPDPLREDNPYNRYIQAAMAF